MADDRHKLYEVSRRELRREIAGRRTKAANAYDRLVGKDTSYAAAIAAMRDLYADILEVIDATPPV